MSKVNQDIIKKIEEAQLRTDMPDFGPGDTVVVQVRVKEGEKERLQAYEGVVIAKRNRGLHSAFTVRKISNGEGVERTFQTHSPAIGSIAAIRRATFSLFESENLGLSFLWSSPSNTRSGPIFPAKRPSASDE